MTKEILDKWLNTLFEYYERIDGLHSKEMVTNMFRLTQPLRLYRVLCSCTYLGKNELFAGGTITKDILRVTGWKMPSRATASQIKQDEEMSIKLEQKCRKYISNKLVAKLIKNQGLMLPVEWRMFYILYVPGNIFTSGELDFMKNNPCWLLPLAGNQPSVKEGEENDD